MAVTHLEGCPKKRKIENRLRTFRRKGSTFTSKTERCIDCGARKASKARKVPE